jgi:co-chaperonin GroES (HSP10)
MKPLRDALPDATENDLFELEQMFPDLPSPYDPLGRWCVVQDRGVAERTKGGIIRPDSVKEADAWQENIGRVLAIGPLAGYDELSGGTLPGAEKIEVGDIVLCSRLSSSREELVERDGRKMTVRMIPDRDIMARVTTAARAMRQQR